MSYLFRSGDPIRLVGEPERRAEAWGLGSLVGKKGHCVGHGSGPTPDLHAVSLFGLGPTVGSVATSALRPASPFTPAEEEELESGCEVCGGEEFVKCQGCGKALCELHEEGAMECGQGDYCPGCSDFVCDECCVALNEQAGRPALTELNPERSESSFGSGSDDEGSSSSGGLDGKLLCGKCGDLGWPRACAAACAADARAAATRAGGAVAPETIHEEDEEEDDEEEEEEEGDGDDDGKEVEDDPFDALFCRGVARGVLTEAQLDLLTDAIAEGTRTASDVMEEYRKRIDGVGLN